MASKRIVLLALIVISVLAIQLPASAEIEIEEITEITEVVTPSSGTKSRDVAWTDTEVETIDLDSPAGKKSAAATTKKTAATNPDVEIKTKPTRTAKVDVEDVKPSKRAKTKTAKKAKIATKKTQPKATKTAKTGTAKPATAAVTTAKTETITTVTETSEKDIWGTEEMWKDEIIEDDVAASEGKGEKPVFTEEELQVPDNSTRCYMAFRLKGWSAFYKSSKGKGLIKCDNGQKSWVTLSAVGGGITFGKHEISNGRGKFTKVDDIGELFGSYASSEAHAGASKSADAQALTKGKVSLAFKGSGKGYDLGFSFGRFKITPIDEERKSQTAKVEKKK